MANTSRSYPKRARQSTGNQETSTTNTYSTARRPRRSAPYSGTSRATASSRNLLSQTTRGTNLLIDESTLGVPSQKYTKVLRYTSSPLDIPYFGNSPNGTFKILTWVKVSELTEEEKKVYDEEEKRKEEQRLIWKKELEKKSDTDTADGADINKETQQSVEVEEEDENKKRKRDEDTSAATGDNDKADNGGTSTTENVNKSEVDITADGDDIDINKGMVKEEDGDVTMDDNTTGTNKNDETVSKSIEEQQQGEQKEEVVIAKEESEVVAAVAVAEETTDKPKEEEKGGEVSTSNSEAVNMDVEMNEDGTNLDKEVTTSTEEMVGGDTKEEEEVKSIQETSSQ